MSVLIDWLFTGIVILLGCILLYPVSKQLGNSFRKIFVKGEDSDVRKPKQNGKNNG